VGGEKEVRGLRVAVRGGEKRRCVTNDEVRGSEREVRGDKWGE